MSKKKGLAKGGADKGKVERIDIARVWEEVEEQFVPKSGARRGERAVYFYLLRAVRLAGKRTALVTIGELAKAVQRGGVLSGVQ